MNLAYFRDFVVFTEDTKIAINSSVSVSRSPSRFAETISPSINNSSQYAVSSSSWRLLSILLINSAFERDLHASLYCAPTLVPLRRSCRPMTCASPDFGRLRNSLIIRKAYCFVRFLRSNSFIHHSIFSFHHYSYWHASQASGFSSEHTRASSSVYVFFISVGT